MRKSLIAIAALSTICWATSQAVAAVPADSASARQPEATTAQKKDKAQKPASEKAQSSGQKNQQQSQKQAESQPKTSHGSEAEQNPFPEEVSRKAAEAREREEQPDKLPATPSATPSAPSSAASANPFPEAVSEKAAQAAQKKQAPQPQYSSSQASSLTAGGESESSVPDPARSRKDVEVADYYMGSGDYRGAYLRFKDAVQHESSNLAAILGLAESARKIGKYDESARNYHIYLEIEPNGAKAKEARKALRQMAGK